MKEFLELIVKSIVNNPDKVVIEETKEDTRVDLLIKVDDSDMGILIGKEGRTIRSVRNLAKSKAIKDNLKINIEIYDPNRNDEI